MGLDDLLTDNKVLLTQLKVRQNDTYDKHLQLSFKGLSDVYLPHLHTYPSLPLTKEQADQLVQVLSQPEIDGHDNPFYEYADSVHQVDEYFHIVQIRAPRRESEEFQKLRYNKSVGEFQFDSQEKGKKIFMGKFFDKHARWNIGYGDDSLQPGTIYDVDDTRFVEVLKGKRNLDQQNHLLQRMIKEQCKQFEPEKRNRVRGSLLSRLRTLFSENEFNEVQEKITKSAYANVATEDILRSAFQLINDQKKFEKEIEGYGRLTYREKKYELFLDKRPNFDLDRQLSPSEWGGLTYLMLDIETPKFMDGDMDITQVSCCLVRNGEIDKLRVYNKEKVSLDEMKCHKVFSGYDNDEDLIDDMVDWMVEEDIDVLMAYNNSFDLKRLRERGDFKAGAGDVPKMDVNKNFFERFFLQGAFCMDLLRVGQTLLRGYPNAKLEMFSRFLEGESGYKKIISYAEMAEMQKLSEGREVDLGETTKQKLRQYYDSIKGTTGKLSASEIASRLILSYVCDDTSTMYDIFFNPLVQKCVADCAQMANHFQLDLTRVLSSGKGLREVYDRGYFKHVGIDRDRIYPRGMPAFEKENLKNERGLKKHIDDILKVEEQEGYFQNVSRRFIPFSVMLRDFGHHATTKVNTFLSSVYRRYGEGADPNELIFLSRYGDGLLDYVRNNIGCLLRKRDGYEQLAEKLSEALLPAIQRNPALIDGLAKELMGVVADQGFFGDKANMHYVLSAVKKLEQQNRFNSEILDLAPKLQTIADQYWLSREDLLEIFWEFFRMRKQQARVGGHYRMPAWDLARILDKELQIQRSKLEAHNEIIHVDYPWIYTIPKRGIRFVGEENLPGLPDTIREIPDNSLFPVQNLLENAYVSKGKVYSKEHGFYKGIKVKPEPAFSTTPFLSDVSQRALDCFMEGNVENGLKIILTARDELFGAIDNPFVDKLNHLSYNKAKQCYVGYQEGEKHQFALPGVHEPDDSENGKPFVMLPKNEPGRKEKKQEKVYIHTLDEYVPDYKAVFEQFRNKMKDFVKGAVAIAFESDNSDVKRIAVEVERGLKGLKEQEKPMQLSLL